MGMKIKQESRVKTFFRKLFKISKKNSKDGSWKHTKLDREALYALSRESGLEILSRSRDYLDTSDKQNSADKVQSDKDLSVEEVTVGDIFEDAPEVQSNETEGKIKLNVNLNKTVRETQAYEKLCDENEAIPKRDTNNRRSKRRNNRKNNSNKDNALIVDDKAQSTDGPEQDLLDVDLDLVLSSFPNLKHPAQNEHGISAEATDNTRNEELACQTRISSGCIRQVEVIVEPARNNRDTSDQKPLEQNSADACPYPSDRYDGRDTVWEELAVDNVERRDAPLAKNKRKNKKSHASNTVNGDDITEESPKDDAKHQNETEVTKPKRRRKAKQGRNLHIHNAENSIQGEAFSSTEPLIMADRAEPTAKSHRRTNSQTYSVLKEVDEIDDVPTEVIAQTKRDAKKKNKRNKKKGNVRKPEDDLAEDLSADLTRRPKHQMMRDPDVITEQPVTGSSVEDMGSKNKKTKKSKRRRVRLKFNRDKKRLAVKRYDELPENDAIETQTKDHGASSPKQVGRRMWQACKSGWKYLRAGLVYYTRTPAAGISFSPIVKRYDDEFGDGGGPFSLA